MLDLDTQIQIYCQVIVSVSAEEKDLLPDGMSPLDFSQIVFVIFAFFKGFAYCCNFAFLLCFFSSPQDVLIVSPCSIASAQSSVLSSCLVDDFVPHLPADHKNPFLFL